MTAVVIPSFSRGEISPTLFGRADLPLSNSGLRKARNAVVHPNGGVSNRAGLRYVGNVKNVEQGARLIPFRRSAVDSYVLEFGHQYIRVIRGKGHVTREPQAISALTANTLTVTGHDFRVGDDIVVQGSSNTEINNRWFRITSFTGDVLTVVAQTNPSATLALDPDGTADGTVAVIYEIGAPAEEGGIDGVPYTFEDLREITYAQEGDVMTLTHPNYRPRELVRREHTNWAICPITTYPRQQAPEAIGALRVEGSEPEEDDTSREVSYAVTGLDIETGEETLPGLSGDGYRITGVNNNFPMQVTFDTELEPVPDPADGVIVDCARAIVLSFVDSRQNLVNFESIETGVSVTRGQGVPVALGLSAPAFEDVVVRLEYDNATGPRVVEFAAGETRKSFTMVVGNCSEGHGNAVCSITEAVGADVVVGSRRDFFTIVRAGTFTSADAWGAPELVTAATGGS